MTLKNPNSILIQNEYYPSGLTELDINSYYLSVKKKLLSQIYDRDVILFINSKLNNTIIRRHNKVDEYININSSTYEKIIHGRVVSIISTMKRIESFGIIDIDYSNFEINKSIVLELINYLEKFKNIENIEVRFTGKTSFHIIVYFKDKQEIDNIRYFLNKILSEKFKDKYSISHKRNLSIPNLDLSPNKFRGGFISQYSLSMIGLRCMKVPLNNIHSFQKEFAKI